MRSPGHDSVAVGGKADKPAKSRSEKIGGPRRHEEACHTVLNQFSAAPDVCGDRGSAGSEPFDDRARDTLSVTW
jgi:hypothetical protein